MRSILPYAEAWYNRGIALNELKRVEEAVESYDHVIAIDPTYEFIYGTRLHTKMRICDWTDLERDISNIAEKVIAGEKEAHPFPLLAAADSPAVLLKAAEVWQAAQTTAIQPPPIEPARSSDKIRIGYFSADFHMHPVAFLLAGVLEHHDRSRFEIMAFSFDVEKPDDMRARLRSCFDEFIDVTGMSDAEVALIARQREIDIAIDLQGLTRGHRTAIFAARAAPLQVGFLGYPCTMGADYIDYLIADQNVVPPSHRSSYREKLVLLPNSFHADGSRARHRRSERDAGRSRPTGRRIRLLLLQQQS